MTEDDFWKIVDDVHAAAGGDMESKERLLEEKLEALDTPAVGAFAGHMDAKMDQAYAWPLWAAAYLIHGGCSDDGFMDFRSSLISMGRGIFERALKQPDTLAELNDETLESLDYEGFLYVPMKVYEAKSGEMPARAGSPAEPSGEAWDEDDSAGLAAMLPELWKRFGW